MQKKIFSAMQPTGIIHLGNYFGAMNNWLSLQKEYAGIFSIVDLHALTIPQKPEELRTNIRNLAKLYLAAGLDPQKNIIFRQSQVHEHAELAWILTCITPISELERMTQYKDKAKQHKENINAGLFTYPCLMAADILLYDTNIVPVGEDQKQHVELARTIANKFNNLYGETFVVPEAMINKETARLRGLDNPEKKMSKSAPSEYNFISLMNKPDLIRKKIQKAVTDSGTEIKFSPERPAISNLLMIYHLVSGNSIKEIEGEFENKGYGDFKKELAERIIEFLTPLQERFEAIDDNELDQVLENGKQRAETLAKKKLKEVKDKIGL
ncbi:tryptophan--tRNA ligase [Patescibacteria group bacterium]|nr:tryptophan--tRNA ligase [Patescibacteria group bacterium]